MSAVDSSVAIAALTAWHGSHAAAREAAAGASIASHAALETYSVLTRLPSPHRIRADIAAQLLGRWFSSNSMVTPTPDLSRTLIARCEERGVEGGAVYDALVGLTCAEAGLTLLTLDRRAITTYDRLDITYELVT